MARAHFYKVIQDAVGDLVTGISVRVCDEGTSDLLADPIFEANTGITELGNPFASEGVIDFYLDAPQPVRVEVTLPDTSVTVFDYQAVGSIQPIVLVDANDVRWEVTVGIDGALTTTIVP